MLKILLLIVYDLTWQNCKIPVSTLGMEYGHAHLIAGGYSTASQKYLMMLVMLL
jgi:hypothetical protein